MKSLWHQVSFDSRVKNWQLKYKILPPAFCLARIFNEWPAATADKTVLLSEQEAGRHRLFLRQAP